MKISGGKFAQQAVLALSDGTLHLDAHLAKAGKVITMDNLRLSRGQAAFTGQASWNSTVGAPLTSTASYTTSTFRHFCTLRVPT